MNLSKTFSLQFFLTASIVLAKSRDLHWTLSVNSKQINNVDMKTVRMMLISDGANPCKFL